VNFSHEYKDDSRILDFNLEEIHCGREIRPISFGGDRLGYFIISGESKESVVDYFKFLEGTIKVEYQA
jgi:hypothetical protein